MSGWGTGAYGTGGWGAATATPGLSLDHVYASGTRAVTVVLTGAPLASNPSAPGDARNVATWTIEDVTSGTAFTPTAVATTDDPTAFVISTLEDLGDYTHTHRVTAAALVDSGGNAATPPLSATFTGVQQRAARNDAPTAADDVVDLRAYHVSRNPVGGTLNVNSAGDYQTMGGVELVRKLIIRRLTTRPGEFFHLPDYGFPFQTADVVRPVELVKLRAALREAVKREPEVKDAGVGLSLDAANGVLTVTVRAALQPAGETLEVNAELPVGAVGF